jgi:acyl-CoA reductase-like NAD-dependent aldehyde dehydrogenase
MARKIKIAAAVEHHKEADVRLAAMYLIKAINAAKAGDVELMATHIRLAAMFEKDFSLEAKHGGPIRG